MHGENDILIGHRGNMTGGGDLPSPFLKYAQCKVGQSEFDQTHPGTPGEQMRAAVHCLGAV